mgnify:CR=1 FL=1
MAKRKVYKTIKGFAYMIIGCGLMLTLFNSAITVFQRQDEIAVLEKEKKAVEKEKKDDDYVARYARENYVFTREGEQVAIIPGVE